MWNQLDRWSVQETKLIPPSRSGPLVERNRLLSRALDGARGRLVLFSAAAGYGKTSLLAQVHEEFDKKKLRVSWVSLDEGDNDHARFLSHLIESLRKSGLRFGAAIATLLGSGAALPPDILRTSLLNELSAIGEEVNIFLDDYHLVSDSEVQGTVAAILLAPLPRVHLLISSRSRTGLPLNRLRTLAQLTEVQGGDLAFSEAEAREFLGRSCRKALDVDQVARLRDQTEGWVASLQLAAIALDGVEDVTQFLDEFSGETRTVDEFLGEEVLRRLPIPMQKFLMETSILKRFNTGLANAVTGRNDSRSMLDELELKALFIFSLDDKGNWYRYHHLFADFLQRRLQDREPGRFKELHARAADWLTVNGFLPEAIDHAFLASDTNLAGRLLDAACERLFATGQISTMQKHAARLPQELLASLPRLQLELTWEHELAWRFTAAETAMSSVRAILDREAAGDGSVIPAKDLSFLECKLAHRQWMLLLLTDRLDEASSLARKWSESTPVDDPLMRVSIGTTVMAASRERYSCEGTSVQAESLYRTLLDSGAAYGTVYQDSVAGVTYFMRGDIEDADRTFTRARTTALSLQGEQSRLTAMPTALLAELCYERGDLERAKALLEIHGGAVAEFGFVDHPIARFVTLSRLASLDGRQREADDLLEAGVAIAEKNGMLRLHAHLLGERVRQMVADGAGKEAMALLEGARYKPWIAAQIPCSDPTATGELLAIAWARAHVDRGEAARAVPVLKRWLGVAKDGRCLRSVARVSAMLARSFECAGEPAAARRVLREALQMTPKGGFVRTFVDEGPAMAKMLREIHGHLVDSDAETARNVETILGAFELEPGDDAAADPNAPRENFLPTDELSGREREIVQLTSQGMATSDISAALGLTESTVKWYWKRILAKLQVHRRFEAVKVARRQGWVA
jgi:LuxR family maltose regulon positive regulatory protein